jgi:hypothetical protein
MIGWLSDSDGDVGIHGRLHGGGQAPLLQLEQLQEGARRHHPVSALRRADWDTTNKSTRAENGTLYCGADPGPFFTPGSGMRKKSGSWNRDKISESLETIFWEEKNTEILF